MEKINGLDSSPNKKATNKDVAKLAGVSVATVSYVINGRDDMRIPETTKKKVMQAINFLNYAPNPYAVGLSGNQTHNIILRSSSTSSNLFDMNVTLFMKSLAEKAKMSNYDVSFSPDKTIERLSGAACVCMGFSKSEFYALANENFIPLISVNTILADPIFYQLSPNYALANEEAKKYFKTDDFCYLALKIECEELKKEILSTFKKVIFISEPNEIASAMSAHSRIAFSEQIFAYLLPVFKTKADCFYIDKTLDCAEKIIESVLIAINRVKTDDDKHYMKF